MPKRSLPLPGRRTGWSTGRRALVLAGVLTGLLVTAGVSAHLTGRDAPPSSPPGGSAADPPRPSTGPAGPPGTDPAPGAGPVPAPPKISDPVAFAEAAAVMLWSYDTRDTDHGHHLAGVEAWMTTESRYRDWSSVSARVPDPTLWSRMADQGQYATADAAGGHYPSAFLRALAEDPAAITEAYIYAVTVTGTQRISWANGGSGAEDRSITLAVQCRPSRACSLVAVAPHVAP
ncbi:hypothetical protein [Streptomyces calidiresistens]